MTHTKILKVIFTDHGLYVLTMAVNMNTFLKCHTINTLCNICQFILFNSNPTLLSTDVSVVLVIRMQINALNILILTLTTMQLWL